MLAGINADGVLEYAALRYREQDKKNEMQFVCFLCVEDANKTTRKNAKLCAEFMSHTPLGRPKAPAPTKFLTKLKISFGTDATPPASRTLQGFPGKRKVSSTSERIEELIES
mmetsp:Transcript_42185/g.127983  ORF Transcript_42185/g.127983 Transcript_42185/m.127983 type:complete len:112 (+) Transcript_42185:824-1159(+)